jgi:carbon monoxide dehydrogenase subunit G
VDFQNSFVVPSDIDTAWTKLQDVEGLAPCMPGATLGSIDGDDFTGSVKVKLGPVTMVYGVVARFVSRDVGSQTVVIDGSGKETKGTGTAQGQVTATLVAEAPDRTRVDVLTQLTVTGKAAQFGRGVIQDVAGRIIDQFSANLAAQMTADSAPACEAVAAEPTRSALLAGATEPSAPRPRRASDEAISLFGTAGAPVLKRAVPLAIGVAVVIAAIIWVVKR